MFSEEETRIFEYSRGAGADGKPVVVKADPMRIWRRLVKELDGDPNGAFASIKNKSFDDDGNPIPGAEETPPDTLARMDAEERMLRAVRAAFGMIDFDEATGRGAVDDDCWAAINSYNSWTAKKKKRGDDSAASSAAGASGPAS